MIPDYFLLKLIEHAQIMRDLQKQYFAEKDFVKKRDFLNQAIRAERNFDEVLSSVKQLLK